MNHALTKAALSPARQRLVRMMHELNFGRLEGLHVCSGEPVFDPAPRVVRQIKLGGDNGPRPQWEHADFALKNQIVELFDHLESLENGTVEALEVQHGLPFRLIVEQPA